MSSCNPGVDGAVVLRRRARAGDQRGAALVEYVLLVSLIAMLSLAALTFMGGSIRAVLVAIAERIVDA